MPACPCAVDGGDLRTPGHRILHIVVPIETLHNPMHGFPSPIAMHCPPPWGREEREARVVGVTGVRVQGGDRGGGCTPRRPSVFSCSAPVEHRTSKPTGFSCSAPVEHRTSKPTGFSCSAPVEHRTSKPTGFSCSAPVEHRTSKPTGFSCSAPVEHRTSKPTGFSCSAPVEHRTSKPTGFSCSAPVEHRTSHLAVLTFVIARASHLETLRVSRTPSLQNFVPPMARSRDPVHRGKGEKWFLSTSSVPTCPIAIQPL